MSWRRACLAALCAAGLGGLPAAGRAREEAVTLWVLPLDNPGRDATLDDLARAVSELLALAFARSSEYAVVDREHLAEVLEEQSLPAAGLAEPGTRHAVGRLLGARWMLQGSLARRGTSLWIAAHVTEVESTRILASAQVEADPSELEPLLQELVEGLMRAVRLERGGAPQGFDRAPEASLHFMRGLSLYYSARYPRALAEFLRSGAEPGLADSSALWRANCYLGLEQVEHAFLELSRLERQGTLALDDEAFREKLARCRERLSADELRTCERLLGQRSAAPPR